MTNTALLVGKIAETGLKYAWIAKQLGLSYYSLRKKIDNVTEFKASEIDALCKVLNIQSVQEKELIFFH